MSSLLSDESISLIHYFGFWFWVWSFTGDKMTRASYNNYTQSNGSCGHHFFHIKTRRSNEHSKIDSRERYKRFSRVFPTRLTFYLSNFRHGTRRNKLILPLVQYILLRWWIKQSVLITVTYIALYIWWLVVHLKTAIHSRNLPLQWVMQTVIYSHYRRMRYHRLSILYWHVKLVEWYNYTGRLCWWWCSHWHHDRCV